ncbi:MAG: hypothetical protein PHQ18_05560 [Patescibacteria group bacterium]|nr:hypothetical protein [Patescibacteria group bacterium]
MFGYSNKTNNHRPHHIYDGYGYFLTARTYNKIHYFDTNERKNIFVQKLKKLSEKYEVGLFSWVLLENHYHIMFYIKDPILDNRKCRLSEFVRSLHSQMTSNLNKIDNSPKRQIWYQYFDYCIRNKADFWKHFNYIIKNPFKHGLTKNLEEAFHYKYSSNPTWLKRFGIEGLNESFIKYPVEEVFVDE